MICCRNRQNSYRTVYLVFERCQLLYDVANYAFVEGDVMPAKDDHERHQVFDVVQDGNSDIVTRILNLAHTDVIENLYPYTKKPVEDREVFDDKLREPEKYVVELRVPHTFSRTSLDNLRWLIHEYFVCRVLYEWMGLTNLGNPSSKQNWQEKIEGLQKKMKTAIVWRGKPTRIRLHPF